VFLKLKKGKGAGLTKEEYQPGLTEQMYHNKEDGNEKKGGVFPEKKCFLTLCVLYFRRPAELNKIR
jgi:hypothetical protein